MGEPRTLDVDLDVDVDVDVDRPTTRVRGPRGGSGPVMETQPAPGFTQPKQPSTASVDQQQVMLMAGYRVGLLPPPVNSVAAGQLFVELTPPGGGAPRLWIGTVPGQGFAGNTVLLIPNAPLPAPSVITVTDPDNPSPNDAVAISGTVTPGCEVEIAALSGTDLDLLGQVTSWSPWDATSGTFSLTWWLPEGDNYRIRVRMRDDPTVFVDSALFAAFAP